MNRTVLCFAHGHEGRWEAICLDYDISIAGRSFEEVRAILGQAIQTYVEDARRESEPSRTALLKRRSPWHVRLKHVIRFLAAALRHRQRHAETRIGFSMPCPV
jgi:hypothetical protein